MANPTTNYSFAMPTNTDLVKDLPADFDIFGQAVDDRIKALNPETTAGDISYRASTANAKTRLAIGTSGQVLTVAGGVPTWATPTGAGLTLISTTTLSGATVTLSSIPQGYTNLQLVIEGYTGNTGNSFLRIAPNNVTNLASSVEMESYSPGGATNVYDNFETYVYPNRLRSSLRTDANNISATTFFNYSSTNGFKPFAYNGYLIGTDSNKYYSSGGGVFASTTAITSLVIQYGGTNTFAGGTVKLFGA